MDPFKPNQAGLVSVKLLKNYASNVAGETAGFLPEIAKALVKDGIAHLPGQPPKAEADKPKTSEPKTAKATTDDAAMTTRKFLRTKPKTSEPKTDA